MHEKKKKKKKKKKKEEYKMPTQMNYNSINLSKARIFNKEKQNHIRQSLNGLGLYLEG